METYINPNAINGFEEANTGDVIAKLDNEHIGFTQAPSGLPDQTGQSGKFLTTNGSQATWGTVNSLPDQTGQSGKFLATNGLQATWEDVTSITIRNWTYE